MGAERGAHPAGPGPEPHDTGTDGARGPGPAGPSGPPAAVRLGPGRAGSGGIGSPRRRRFIVAAFPHLFSLLFFWSFSSPNIFSMYFPLPSISRLFCVLFRCSFPRVSARRWQVPVPALRSEHPRGTRTGLRGGHRLHAAHPRSSSLPGPAAGDAPADPSRTDRSTGAAVCSSPVKS